MATRTSSRSSNGSAAQAEAPKESNKPVWKRRAWTGAGAVEVSVFSKVKDDVENFFVAVRRTWKSDDGYHEGNLFSPHELLILADLVRKANDFIEAETNRE